MKLLRPTDGGETRNSFENGSAETHIRAKQRVRVRRQWILVALILIPGLACTGKTGDDSVNLESVGRNIERNKDDKITSITFRLNKVTDTDLTNISRFKHLRHLSIQECGDVTDASLKEIAKLTELRTLKISHVPITDAGLESLTSLKHLKTVWLQHTNVTGSGLKSLADLSLQELHLAGPKLVAKELTALPKLTGLKELKINQHGLDLADFPSLKTLTELETLNLQYVNVDEKSIVRFAGLPQLKTPVLDGAGLNDKTVALLATSPLLEIVDLSESTATNDGLTVLARHQKLRKIMLGPMHNDAALRILANLPAMRHVDGRKSKITGSALPSLFGMKTLKEVDLNVKSVTTEGRAAAKVLRKSLPKVVIYAMNLAAGSAERL